MELKEEIGINAGRLWNTISRVNKASFTKLRSESDLGNNQVYEAIGWLAREDKISKEGRDYVLKSTNLTFEVGTNAGKIYDLIKENNNLSLKDLVERSDMRKKDILTAIGWLSKENKLEQDENGRFTIRS